MKYRLFLSAIVTAILMMGLSSCYYGSYHHRPRPHYYRPNHHGYHHGN